MQTEQNSIASHIAAGLGNLGDHTAQFGDSGDRTSDFGASSPRKTGNRSQKVTKLMPTNQLPNPNQGIQDVEFKFLNLLQFRAKVFPSWLFVVLLGFVLLALYLIITYPLPAIISGIGTATIAAIPFRVKDCVYFYLQLTSQCVLVC